MSPDTPHLRMPLGRSPGCTETFSAVALAFAAGELDGFPQPSKSSRRPHRPATDRLVNASSLTAPI